MLSVHVMTNVPPLARSYQDGGCRIAERVGIRTIRKQTNKLYKTNPIRRNQTNKKGNKTKLDKTKSTRSYQDGGCRIAERVSIRPSKQANKTEPTNKHKYSPFGFGRRIGNCK